MPQVLVPVTSQHIDHALLDHVIRKLHLKNDAALSRLLEVQPPVISKIRHRALPVGAVMILRLHEVCLMSIAEIRALIEQSNRVASYS